MTSRGYNTKNFKQKKKRLYYIKLAIFFSLIIGLLIGLVILIRHPALNITEVEIEGVKLSNKNTILSKVEESLDKNLLFFLPRSNFVLLPQFEIKELIKENNPAVSEVALDLVGINKLVVNIKEYEPSILWCKTSGGCLFVNEEGKAFSDEPFIHGYNNLIKFEGADSLTELGSEVMDRVFLNNILKFVEKLKGIDIKVNTINSPDRDVYYLDTTEGFEILISSSDDLEESFQNLKVILEKDTIDVETLNAIDYIDLRFGNKIFYKLKS